MTAPAEIRAEGRRLRLEQEGPRLAEAGGAVIPGSSFKATKRLVDYLYDHADVLLADPAPVGLTEDERDIVERSRGWMMGMGDRDPDRRYMAGVIAVLDSHFPDRLSAAPVDDREREGEVLALLRKIVNGEGYINFGHECGHPFLTIDTRFGLTEAELDLIVSLESPSVPVSPSVDPEEEP